MQLERIISSKNNENYENGKEKEKDQKKVKNIKRSRLLFFALTFPVFFRVKCCRDPPRGL